MFFPVTICTPSNNHLLTILACAQMLLPWLSPCPFPDGYSPLGLGSQAYCKRHRVPRGATRQPERLFHSMCIICNLKHTGKIYVSNELQICRHVNMT